jgi:hypothetical protein
MEHLEVDRILTGFFQASARARHPETVIRYGRVQAGLRSYLETDGAGSLAPEAAALLELERQFAPEDAYVRLMGAAELLHALPGFLGPRWLAADFHDRLAQISLASRLAQWLCTRQLVDRKAQWGDVLLTRAAAEHARRTCVT